MFCLVMDLSFSEKLDGTKGLDRGMNNCGKWNAWRRYMCSLQHRAKTSVQQEGSSSPIIHAVPIFIRRPHNHNSSEARGAMREKIRYGSDQGAREATGGDKRKIATEFFFPRPFS